MEKQILKLLILAAGFLAFGCAHHRDVRPGATGDHKVILKTEDKDEGYRNAMMQAEDFCKMKQLSPVIVKEGSNYCGNLDEKTYNVGKTASKVAKAAGGTVWALGGKTESNAGGVVGLGGTIADTALGKGYTYEMIFRCQ